VPAPGLPTLQGGLDAGPSGHAGRCHRHRRRLHADRLGPDGPRTHVAPLGSLPDGTLVEHDDTFWLVRGERLHAWTFGGYRAARPRSEFPTDVVVRTPRATVATLRAGFQPAYHPTAT
jgi:hypothetical protein